MNAHIASSLFLIMLTILSYLSGVIEDQALIYLLLGLMMLVLAYGIMKPRTNTRDSFEDYLRTLGDRHDRWPTQ